MLDKTLFVSDTLHQRTVKLEDGSEHILHFKELPAVSFRAFHIAEQSADEGVQAGSMAKLIAMSLCEPDGKPAITYAQALKLKSGPANAMMTEILAINGFGAAKEKNDLQPKATSGSGKS